jgi:hypothetical protein
MYPPPPPPEEAESQQTQASRSIQASRTRSTRCLPYSLWARVPCTLSCPEVLFGMLPEVSGLSRQGQRDEREWIQV